MSFLIDTNVISELSREQPEARVIGWFERIPDDEAFVSATSWAELRYGVARLPSGKRSEALAKWLDGTVMPHYAHRTLPVDFAVAAQWGQTVAEAERKGVPTDAIDAFIAATALVYDLTVVTRNEKDFEPLGVRVFNPWAA